MKDIKKRVAIDAGGSKGIGRAIAYSIAKAGALVTIFFKEYRVIGHNFIKKGQMVVESVRM